MPHESRVLYPSLSILLLSGFLGFCAGLAHFRLYQMYGPQWNYIFFPLVGLFAVYLALRVTPSRFALAASTAFFFFIAALRMYSITMLTSVNLSQLAKHLGEGVITSCFLWPVALGIAYLITYTKKKTLPLLEVLKRVSPNPTEFISDRHTPPLEEKLFTSLKSMGFFQGRPFEATKMIAFFLIFFMCISILLVGILIVGLPLGFVSIDQTVAILLELFACFLVFACLLIFFENLMQLPPTYRRRLSNTVGAFVTSYFFMTFIFGVFFWSFYQANKSNFLVKSQGEPSFLDFQFYSFSTITTLGYGELVPNSFNTKIGVVSEVVFGLFLTVLFLGFLISVSVSRPK